MKQQYIAVATFIASMTGGTTALAQDFSGCIIDNLFQRIDCNGVVKSFAEAGYREGGNANNASAPAASSNPNTPSNAQNLTGCTIDHLFQRINCNGVEKSFAEMGYSQGAQNTPSQPSENSPSQSSESSASTVGNAPSAGGNPSVVGSNDNVTAPAPAPVPAPPTIFSGGLKQVKAVRYKPLNLGDPRLNTNYSYYWAEVYPGRYAEFLSLGIVDAKLGLAACERYRDQLQGHVAIDFLDGSSLAMDVSPSNRDLLDRIVSIGNFLPGTIYFEPLTNDKLYLRVEKTSIFSPSRIKDIHFNGRSLMEEPSLAPNCDRYAR